MRDPTKKSQLMRRRGEKAEHPAGFEPTISCFGAVFCFFAFSLFTQLNKFNLLLSLTDLELIQLRLMQHKL